MANKWKPSLTPRCSLQEPRVPESFCKVPNFASSFIFNSWYRYNRQFSRAFLDLCSAPPYICRNISLGILRGGNKSTIEELKSTCDQVKWLQWHLKGHFLQVLVVNVNLKPSSFSGKLFLRTKWGFSLKYGLKLSSPRRRNLQKGNLNWGWVCILVPVTVKCLPRFWKLGLAAETSPWRSCSSFAARFCLELKQ